MQPPELPLGFEKIETVARVEPNSRAVHGDFSPIETRVDARGSCRWRIGRGKGNVRTGGTGHSRRLSEACFDGVMYDLAESRLARENPVYKRKRQLHFSSLA